LILITLITVTCKKQEQLKDELTGDKSILIGSWEWIYSDHYFGWCEGNDWEETLTPFSENVTFSLQLTEAGMVYYYYNNKLISEYRIKFVQFENSNQCLLSNAYFLGIDLNNNESLNFNGCVNSDTLRLGSFSGFIFQSVPGCENYRNFFIKQ